MSEIIVLNHKSEKDKLADKTFYIISKTHIIARKAPEQELNLKYRYYYKNEEMYVDVIENGVVKDTHRSLIIYNDYREISNYYFCEELTPLKALLKFG